MYPLPSNPFKGRLREVDTHWLQGEASQNTAEDEQYEDWYYSVFRKWMYENEEVIYELVRSREDYTEACLDLLDKLTMEQDIHSFRAEGDRLTLQSFSQYSLLELVEFEEQTSSSLEVSASSIFQTTGSA